jgi:hypothetical protein
MCVRRRSRAARPSLRVNRWSVSATARRDGWSPNGVAERPPGTGPGLQTNSSTPRLSGEPGLTGQSEDPGRPLRVVDARRPHPDRVRARGIARPAAPGAVRPLCAQAGERADQDGVRTQGMAERTDRRESFGDTVLAERREIPDVQTVSSPFDHLSTIDGCGAAASRGTPGRAARSGGTAREIGTARWLSIDRESGSAAVAFVKGWVHG